MNKLDKIEDNLKKITMLSELYDDLLERGIASEEELEITKAKAKVAKQEKLRLIFENHKLISESIEKTQNEA
ncbi:MAG: hypothetical protein KKF44_07510 [Nanoarchaeota archaeon]|nr:hypothetical protein [Nanoarchaeota archaeon]